MKRQTVKLKTRSDNKYAMTKFSWAYGPNGSYAHDINRGLINRFLTKFGTKTARVTMLNNQRYKLFICE